MAKPQEQPRYKAKQAVRRLSQVKEEQGEQIVGDIASKMRISQLS